MTEAAPAKKGCLKRGCFGCLAKPKSNSGFGSQVHPPPSGEAARDVGVVPVNLRWWGSGLDPENASRRVFGRTLNQAIQQRMERQSLLQSCIQMRAVEATLKLQLDEEAHGMIGRIIRQHQMLKRSQR